MATLNGSIPNGHKWSVISDLSPDTDSLRDRELESLSLVWADQKAAIEIEDHVAAFNEELARQWAIETGIIEGVYTLTRGITQTLIERGIGSSQISHDSTNRDPELVARIIQGHQAALEGLFSFVRGERELGTSYVRELHAALLQQQETVVVFDQFGKAFETPLEKGSYKKLPNNPMRPDGTVHEYCPPEHVASEMDRLIELHRAHRSRGVAAHIEAAWLHHAFTQIHPFQDGNGRVARALASLVFIRAGSFPLVVTRDDRAKYIEVLELADGGDLPPLVRFFAQLQKRVLTKAIGHSVDVKPAKSLQDALDVTRDLLVKVGKIIPPEYLEAKRSATKMLNVTQLVINGAVESLQKQIAQANQGFAFSPGTLGGPPVGEMRTVGEKLHYDPNLQDHFQNYVMNLSAAGVGSRIVVALTSVGSAFKGIIAVTAYFQAGNSNAIPLADDIFRIDYKEPVAEIQTRYDKWLDAVMIRGLAEWRRTLI
jgi:Fic family protein